MRSSLQYGMVSLCPTSGITQSDFFPLVFFDKNFGHSSTSRPARRIIIGGTRFLSMFWK